MLSRYEIMRLSTLNICLPTDTETMKYSETDQYPSELWEKAGLCAEIVKMIGLRTSDDEIAQEAAILMNLSFDQLKSFYDQKKKDSVTFGQYDDLLGTAREALRHRITS